MQLRIAIYSEVLLLTISLRVAFNFFLWEAASCPFTQVEKTWTWARFSETLNSVDLRLGDVISHRWRSIQSVNLPNAHCLVKHEAFHHLCSSLVGGIGHQLPGPPAQPSTQLAKLQERYIFLRPTMHPYLCKKPMQHENTLSSWTLD